jgi:hypothetical protein
MNPISSVRILLVFAGKQLTLGTLAPTAREPERARRKDPRRIFDLEGGGDETPPRPRGVATRSIRESQRPRDRRPVVIGHAIFPRRTRSLARKFLRESEARILPLPPPALPLAGMFSGAVFGERKFVKVTPRRREHYLRSREARGSADREKAERKVSWGGEGVVDNPRASSEGMPKYRPREHTYFRSAPRKYPYHLVLLFSSVRTAIRCLVVSYTSSFACIGILYGMAPRLLRLLRKGKKIEKVKADSFVRASSN